MNINSKITKLVLMLVLLTTLLPSCATMDENQRLGGAAVLGAAAGLATALITGDVGAGIAVGMAGAALGWGAVKLMQPESQQVRTKEEDQRLYGFAPATNKVLVKLNKGYASPNMLKAGEQTTIYNDYSLSVPRSQKNQAEVTYSWKLKKDGKVLTESEPVSQIKMAAGHQTMQPIDIPRNAKGGTYVVETRLASGSAYDVNETIFVVE